MGPVINESAVERILGMIERAKASGAKLLTGGHRLGGELAGGYFLAPTVLADVDHSSEIAQEEVFGPVLSVLRFKDEAEVIAKANDSRYGLAAYIHTRDLARAHRVAHAIDAGYINVNGMSGMSPTAPFGGYKQSGFGREGGRQGLEEWLRTKNVFISLD
jgi:aldehyde dehydrogenase (NAD+)